MSLSAVHRPCPAKPLARAIKYKLSRSALTMAHLSPGMIELLELITSYYQSARRTGRPKVSRKVAGVGADAVRPRTLPPTRERNGEREREREGGGGAL